MWLDTVILSLKCSITLSTNGLEVNLTGYSNRKSIYTHRPRWIIIVGCLTFITEVVTYFACGITNFEVFDVVV